jgi:hypothetical protein
MSIEKSKSRRSNRDQLNAIRKSNALMQGGILLLFGAVLVGMALAGTRSVVFLLVLFVMIHALRLVGYQEKCPACEEDLSALPNEGRLRIPELSRAVRQCPYCGADFSYRQDGDDTG